MKREHYAWKPKEEEEKIYECGLCPATVLQDFIFLEHLISQRGTELKMHHRPHQLERYWTKNAPQTPLIWWTKKFFLNHTALLLFVFQSVHEESDIWKSRKHNPACCHFEPVSLCQWCHKGGVCVQKCKNVSQASLILISTDNDGIL